MNVQDNSSNGQNDSLLAEINVTPFVDVMLVLLVIFMVTAPLMQQGVRVDLPATKAEALQQQTSQIVLSVTPGKQFFINDQEFDESKLYPKLEEIYRQRTSKEVFLRADKSLSYGFIVDVMARIKKAGIINVGLITDARLDQIDSKKKAKK